MKKFSCSAAMNPTTLRLRFFRLGCRRGTGILLLSVCTVFACFAALNFAAKRSVMAKNADLRAIAQRYPKYTRQRQMAIVRARQAMLHPSWRDLSFSQAVAALLKITAAKFSSASTTATVPLANFLGNLTAITAPGIDDLYLERESDCSLTLNTGTFNYTFGGTPSLSVDGATTHYDKTLHSEAQLSTTGGAFPNGCADPTMGISTRRDIYLGKTSQNLTMYAGAGYYAPNGTNALYYGTGDPVAKQVSTFVVDTSDPDVIGVAGGDLNGDGLSDLVTIDQISAAASVNVRLAHLDGTIAAGVSYPVTGTTSLAATVDDVNGDGKADVVVASVDSSGQEYVSVLTGNGDGTLNAAVSMKVPTPTYPTAASSGSGSPPVIESTGSIRIANLITVDLRGTGHKDIVTSNGVVLLNNGSGAFTVSATAAFTASEASSSFGPNLASGDLNNDGKQDIVLNDGAEVSVFLGNGDGTFTPGQTYATISDVGYVTITDLDGDGNADVYVGLGNGNYFGGDQFNLQQAYALMGNGDGTLRGAAALPFMYSGSNLADLNGDGLLDAVGVSSSAFTDVVTLTSYLEVVS